MLRKAIAVVVLLAGLVAPAFGLQKPSKKHGVVRVVTAPVRFVYHVPGKIGHLFRHGKKTPKAPTGRKGLKPLNE